MALKYLNFTGLTDLVTNIMNWVTSRIPTKTSEIDNDSGYLTASDLPTNHVTTNTHQTITGIKTFQNTGINLKQTGITLGTTPSSSQYRSVQSLDNGGTAFAQLVYVQRSDGNTYIELRAGDKFTSGVKATSGTQVWSDFQVGTSSNGNKYIYTDARWSNNLEPYSNNVNTLGSSSYKWNQSFVNEYHAYNANAYMAKQGNYTFLIRNDGNATYFLVSASGGGEGTWSNARPLTITNSTGVCNINGNSATATEFSANKDITLTGYVHGTASSKAGWSLTTALKNCYFHTAGTVTNTYFKVASGVVAGGWNRYETLIRFVETTGNASCTLRVYITLDGSSLFASGNVTILNSVNFGISSFNVVYKNDTDKVLFEIYYQLTPKNHQVNALVLYETERKLTNTCDVLTMYNDSTPIAALPSDYTLIAPEFEKYCGDLVPAGNNKNLGSTDAKWSNVYASNYYLGTTAFGDIVTHNASEFLTNHQSLSNYVTLNGTQTVSGQKTFSANQFFTSGIYQRNNNYTLGNTVTDNQLRTFTFADSANAATGYCRSVIYKTSNITSTEIAARNKIKNGALDTTGSVVTAQFFVRVESNGTKYIAWEGSVKNSIIPYATNTHDLGSSTAQWNNTYTNKLYLNGTEFKISDIPTKTSDLINDSGFLTSHQSLANYINDSTDQVINANKTFRPSITLQDSNVTSIDTTQSTLVNKVSQGNVYFKAANQIYGTIEHYFDTDRSSVLEFNSFNKKTTSQSIYANVVLRNNIDGSAEFSPKNSSSYVSLGSADRPWHTINGINPGSLGLPSVGNATAYEIDPTGWDVTGADIHVTVKDAYNNTVPGYLMITLSKCAATDYVIIQLTSMARSAGVYVPAIKSGSNYYVKACFPTSGDCYVNVVKTTGTIGYARLYPFIGNHGFTHPNELA